MKMSRGRTEILCVRSGALKYQWGKGEGIKSVYRSRKHGTLDKSNKNQLLHLCDNRANPVIWDPSFVFPYFPGGNFPSNHACRANQPIEKQDSG